MNDDAYSHLDALDYDWAKDFRNVKRNSRVVESIDSPPPNCPVSLVIRVIKDAEARPEIMAAYASAPVDGDIPGDKIYLLQWYSAYQLHKYGNLPNPEAASRLALRKLANGEFSSPQDPKLRKYLLEDPTIYDDKKR